MMAFFLLLWLLNVTTESNKQGISNYFEPDTSEEENWLVLGKPSPVLLKSRKAL